MNQEEPCTSAYMKMIVSSRYRDDFMNRLDNSKRVYDCLNELKEFMNSDQVLEEDRAYVARVVEERAKRERDERKRIKKLSRIDLTGLSKILQNVKEKKAAGLRLSQSSSSSSSTPQSSKQEWTASQYLPSNSIYFKR